MKEKKDNNFYSATDAELDKNGFMSICRDCANEIFNDAYLVERNFEKALLKSCKILNVAWVPSAVDAAKTHITKLQSEGKEDISYFGIYKSKMSSFTNINRSLATTYYESIDGAININPDAEITDDKTFDEYLERFWGKGLPFDDYEFLESELARYKKTHRCDTAAEESLLRQICFAELDIRKSRKGESSTPDASAIERLQKLMKTASVDPAKTSVANSGKAQDNYSSFIKIIEENEPADYYEDKKLFKDFDGLDHYFKKYVTRPLKNFITQSRDFNVESDEYDNEAIEEVDDGNISSTLQA